MFVFDTAIRSQKRPKPDDGISLNLDSRPAFSELLVRAYGDKLCNSHRQEYLTKKFILPHQEAIVSLVQELRDEADKQFVGGVSLRQLEDPIFKGIMHPALYPQGHCLEIRDYVYTRLRLLMKLGVSSPAVEALNLFRHNHGEISKIYGVVNLKSGGRFFQNFIRVGSLILDCAVDAGTNPNEAVKVLLRPIGDGVYQDVHSFQQYYEVQREYWGARFISTARYFPYIAPFFPIMTMSTNRAIGFDIDWGLFYRNIMEGFKPALSFMRETTLPTVPLPKELYSFCMDTWGSGPMKNTCYQFKPTGMNPLQPVEGWRRRWKDLQKDPIKASEAACERVRDEAREISRGVEEMGRVLSGWRATNGY